MIMVEFYRQRIAKLDDEIRDARNNQDFKKMVKLQAERLEVEGRIKEIEGGQYA